MTYSRVDHIAFWFPDFGRLIWENSDPRHPTRMATSTARTAASAPAASATANASAQPPPATVSRWRRLGFHGRSGSLAARGAVTSSPHGAVLKEGLLLKKGHVMPTQKERYFVLRPKLLSYFRPSKDPATAPADPAHLKGVIELAATDLVTPIATSRHWLIIQKLSGPDGKSYKLELRCPLVATSTDDLRETITLTLALTTASTTKERQQWIDALRAACRESPAVNAQSARDAELERQLTRTMTMLRVRDPTVVSTVLRQQQQQHPSAAVPHGRTDIAADLRASFQTFHELVLLQALLSTIKATWGDPSKWTCEQYDQLVHSIMLAEERAGPSMARQQDSVVGEASAMRYAFEEVPANQQKLLHRQAPPPATAPAGSMKVVTPSLHQSVLETVPGRERCPTIYGYLSTFERLSLESERLSAMTTTCSEDSERRSSASASSARSSLTGNGPLTPRSVTLAKYAHMYLEEEGKRRKPWDWNPIPGDDLLDDGNIRGESVTQRLIERFEQDRIYSYARHHSLLCINPNRVLKTAKFTSIYDEQVVLLYAQTPFSRVHLAPHPFAMAKQALFRLFLGGDRACETSLMTGESGSGKTELSKELLKYVVTTTQPPTGKGEPRVVLYTSSTKSTFQMRSEETRTLDLLHAKGIRDYEVVLLDIAPYRWAEMTNVSKSKRLPQVHVDGLFFGFYEALQRLEDEEQLRMYFHNPHVAKKLSCVLDSNILLEAFGHAATTMNLNSSRYGKTVELHFAFGDEPSIYQLRSCAVLPSLLEKSRVTNARGDQKEKNFHVFYALVAGVNNLPDLADLAKRLHLQDCSADQFAYLVGQNAPSKVAKDEASRNSDIERLQNILSAMEAVGLTATQREATFRVLSAILWLGNLEFCDGGSTGRPTAQGCAPSGKPIAQLLQDLLGLESGEALSGLLFTRRVEMANTGEVFDVQLNLIQAQHGRDTLSRFLYQAVFEYLIAGMNQAMGTSGGEGPCNRVLRITDMFGFENLQQNSLEQLCINYLTEKLAVAEEQIVAAYYDHGRTQNPKPSEGVLYLFEHSLGVFATLEEQTILHQGENLDLQREQQKNVVFVRYTCQRNPLVPAPPHLKQLAFSIPHVRDTVEYDATDFVKKNSDFQFADHVRALEKTRDSTIQQIIRGMSITSDGRGSKGCGSTTGSGSLVAQFRVQIQRQLSLLNDATSSQMPLFFHCFRPNSTGWKATVDRSVLSKQHAAHRLDGLVKACEDNSTYFEVKVCVQMFQKRYRCLLSRADPTKGASRLREHILKLFESTPNVQVDTVVVGDKYVELKTVEMAERLELWLAKHQADAAIKIQAAKRMWTTRRWYRGIQSNRRSIERDLMELYGPNSTKKIEKTLRKYQDRENELVHKIADKKSELAAVAEISEGMQIFFAHTGMATVAMEEVLKDPDIQRLLTTNERVVPALREMSLNPQVLTSQLMDPVLRSFYQTMLGLLQSKMAATAETGSTPEKEPSSPLEERVRDLVTRHRALWLSSAEDKEWSEIYDQLLEMGDEPEMFLFYQDDEGFVASLTKFVQHCERTWRSSGATSHTTDPGVGAVDATAKLLDKVLRVEFNSSLMAAMQGDHFFVEALQKPQLVSAVHQFMTDRQGFASHGTLRDPIVADFFLRLVRLSDATRNSD